MSLSTEEIDNQMSELCCSGRMMLPSEDSWRLWSLWLLINIAEAVENFTTGSNAPPSAANFIEEGEMAAASITNSYQVLLPGTDEKLFILLRNDTDQKLYYSFDGVSDDISLNAGESIRVEPGLTNHFIDTPISVKGDGTTLPTDGATRANAFS